MEKWLYIEVNWINKNTFDSQMKSNSIDRNNIFVWNPQPEDCMNMISSLLVVVEVDVWLQVDLVKIQNGRFFC